MGKFLTVGYCSRTIGYCFPYHFLEIIVGEQGFDGGAQSCDGGSPTRENPVSGGRFPQNG